MDEGTEEASNATSRSLERKFSQKLPIPIIEKNKHTSVRLWWREFVQYIKMTRDIGLSKMRSSKEILSHYREQLEENIKAYSYGQWEKQQSRK